MTENWIIAANAAFVLRRMPESAQLVRAARTNAPCQPEEVYIEMLGLWVRLNGQWISGRFGMRGVDPIGFRPGFISRWRIRRAARAWERNNVA